MLVLGLIDTGLELVPADLATHSVIKNTAAIRGKAPTEILLDERIHSKALHTLPEAEKRGRPDIAHRSLLVALDSVLAKEQQLEVFFQAYSGEIVQIAPKTRLPRRTPRFVGLMEQLLLNQQVPPTGTPLLQVIPGTLKTYLKTMKPSQITLLSEQGTPMSPQKLAQSLQKETKPPVLVGGFAHGEPRKEILQLADQQISIDPEALPTSTIVGMIIHSLELVLDLSTHRFRQHKETG